MWKSEILWKYLHDRSRQSCAKLDYRSKTKLRKYKDTLGKWPQETQVEIQMIKNS
jgi:hypothetical protein